MTFEKKNGIEEKEKVNSSCNGVNENFPDLKDQSEI